MSRKPMASLHYIDHNDGEGERPMLVISRVTSGRERQVVHIPQNHAHQFCSESVNVCGHAVARKAFEYCEHLYGPGLFNKSEAKYVGDLILDNLESLVRMPPAPNKSQREIEQAIERAGLKIDINGENVIDAS